MLKIRSCRNKKNNKRGTKTQATIAIENRMYNTKTASLW